MESSGKKDSLTEEIQKHLAEFPAWAFPRRLESREGKLWAGDRVFDYLPSREELRGDEPPQDIVEQVRDFLSGNCLGTGDVKALTDRIFEEVSRSCEEAYYRVEAEWARKRGEEIELIQAKKHGWSYPQSNQYEQIKEFYNDISEAFGKLGHLARNTILYEIDGLSFKMKLAILAGSFTERNDFFIRMEGDRLTEVAKRLKQRGAKRKVERKEMLKRWTALLREHLGRSPTQRELGHLQKIIFGETFAVKTTVAEANKRLPPEDFLNWFNRHGIIPENIRGRQARLEALRKANADLRKYRSSEKRALTKEEEETLYASIWPD